MDPVTYIEVSIVGDPHMGEKVLTKQVIRKLERIVYKRKFDKNTLTKEADNAVPRGKRQDFPSGWDL